MRERFFDQPMADLHGHRKPAERQKSSVGCRLWAKILATSSVILAPLSKLPMEVRIGYRSRVGLTVPFRRHLHQCAVGSICGAGNTVLRTIDGGESWTTQAVGQAYGLTSIVFSRCGYRTAVGLNGIIVHTTNGGATWGHQYSGTTDYAGEC